jgi:hypothetical protein
MQFHEKLDFLMNITKTSNSSLAHSASVDASYISRLRSGKRFLPKNDDIVRCIASYFERHCTQAYQQKAIKEALKSDNILLDEINLTAAITHWLLHENKGGSEKAGVFLESLSGMAKKPITIKPPESDNLFFPKEVVSIYYGIQGKRQAVLHFLSEVASKKKPHTLLLYSDEETSWMTGDPTFSRMFEQLMMRVLAQGNKIKVIHNVSRNLDEMLSAISQWLPLYMTGTIEPFFYPKKRDGVFQRTLFIAPETAAVVSNSAGDMIKQAANVLFRDQAAVKSYTEEFMQFLHLCRPLMRIMTESNKESFFSMLTEFEQEKADALIRTESLSLSTMPKALIIKILQRAGIDDPVILNIHRSLNHNFQQTILKNRFTEIVSLPEPETLKKGKVKVGTSYRLNGETIYYTAEEYIEHIANIIELLQAHENFRVKVIKKPPDDRYAIYVREEIGVIITKTSGPPIAIAINESNMTSAFWDFLKDIIGESYYDQSDNEVAIKHLRSYIKSFDCKD